MLGSLKIKIVFFLELLEFSEDRHRWESVEEKLNAIRCELLAFVVCFYRSFICPSLRPLVVPISLSVLTSLLAPSPFLHPCLPPPTSLVHCLPVFVSSLLSPFYPHHPVLRFLRPVLHALSVLVCSFILLVYLPPPSPSLPLILTQRTHAPITFHSSVAFLTGVILIFCLASQLSLFHFSFQRHDEKDGKTDEGWKRMKSFPSR